MTVDNAVLVLHGFLLHHARKISENSNYTANKHVSWHKASDFYSLFP